MENTTILGKCGVCLRRINKSLLQGVTVPTVSIEDSDITQIKIKITNMDICPNCGTNLALTIFEEQSFALKSK